MVSGTSRSGGETPGHVNQERIKQDLPKKETQKLHPISPTTSTFDPLKPFSRLMARMPSLRIPSSRPHSSPLPISTAVTLALVRDSVALKSALPIVSPRPLSPQDLEPVLITNNPELAKSIRIFYAASDRLLDIFPGVKAMLEGGTSTGRRDMLAASMASLEKVKNKVEGVYRDQLNMQKKQQPYGDSLDAELRGIDSRKDMYHTIFTSLPTVCGAGALVASKLFSDTVAIAALGFATVTYVLCTAVGKRMETHQDDLKIRVKKCKDIIEAINGASKLAVGHLDDIMALAGGLKSHTESVLKMVESRASECDAIVTEIEALKRGFQELETKVERCSTDANSGRQAVVQTITNNLDKSS